MWVEFFHFAGFPAESAEKALCGSHGQSRKYLKINELTINPQRPVPWVAGSDRALPLEGLATSATLRVYSSFFVVPEGT